MTSVWTTFRFGDTLILRGGDRVTVITTPTIRGTFKAIDERTGLILHYHVDEVRCVEGKK